jgi:hypothetical protein
MKAAAARWCAEVAGRRAHRGIDGAAPPSMPTAVQPSVAPHV